MIDPSFQEVNRLFVLSFENEDDQESYSKYYLPTIKIRDYNVTIDERNYFDWPIKSDLRTYDKIWKIATGQGDDYITGCFLDYQYFEKYYKLIAIDLSKQQKLDANPKALQQINFTRNLEGAEGTAMFFIIKEAKETILDFSQGTMRVL